MQAILGVFCLFILIGYVLIWMNRQRIKRMEEIQLRMAMMIKDAGDSIKAKKAKVGK